MLLLRDWEREHILDKIYLEEEKEFLAKELNEKQPAKIIVKGIIKEEIYDEEFFNIPEIN